MEKHLSTWVGQTITCVQCRFHCYIPSLQFSLAKMCVNIRWCHVAGSTYLCKYEGQGGEKGQAGVKKMPDITRFIYSLNEKAIMQHLKDCTGKQADPMRERVEPLILALPLKERSRARTTLWSKSYVSVIKKTLDLVLIFSVNKWKKRKNKKQLYDTLAYIFIWKEYNAKHFCGFL